MSFQSRMTEPTTPARLSRFFWIACALEGALLPVAAMIAYFARQPLLSDFHWNPTDLLLGLGATIPLLALSGGC